MMFKRLTKLFACCAVFAFIAAVGAQEGMEEGGGEGGKKKGKRERGEKGEKGEKPPRKKRERPKPEEVTLTGKLTKKESERKGKKNISYSLATEDGKNVNLPKPKAPKKPKEEGAEAPEAINLDDFVDKNVTVVVMALKQKRKGKETLRVYTVKSISEAGGGAEKEEGVAEAKKEE